MINVFAVNFKLSNGEWNSCVEEANYLNKRIVKRLSYVDPSQDLENVEFFLTSTEFQGDVYGECAANYKKRLGLKGDADLFVLRNVVMSPFPTAGNFVGKLAAIFRTIVEEEVKVCQDRTSIDPAIHRFVIQGTQRGSDGTGELYLAYQPYFHEADCLNQLIVSAKIGKDETDAYMDKREQSGKCATFCVEVKDTFPLPDILEAGAFTGRVTMNASRRGDDGGNDDNGQESSEVVVPVIPNVDFRNIKVIKNRSLRELDSEYPDRFMPFYLYGSAAEGDQHIAHMLLKAPNINLCADNVSLSLDRALSPQHLQAGCIAYATEIFERSRQPFDRNSSNRPPTTGAAFFAPGSALAITVYADPNGPSGSGPGGPPLLSQVDVSNPLAKGTMTLAGKVYVDARKINEDGLDGLLWDGSEWAAAARKKGTSTAGLSGRNPPCLAAGTAVDP